MLKKIILVPLVAAFFYAVFFTAPASAQIIAGTNCEVESYTELPNGRFRVTCVSGTVVNDVIATCPSLGLGDCIQYAVNEMQLASAVPSATLLTNAISIDASQASCYAPCGIHFNSVVTGDFAVDSDFHHLAYHWNFGDEGSTFRSLPDDFTFSDSANRAQGAQSAHVFESVGTYDVTLKVAARNGRYAETTLTINVLDPGDSYASSNTMCVSTSSNFTGCPTGAAQLTSWQAVIDAVDGGLTNSGSYILLRAGDTFYPDGRLLLRSNSHVVTRFGIGADPIISVDSNIEVFYTLPAVTELSVSYVQIIGSYDTATGLGDSYASRAFFLAGGDNVTIYRTLGSGLGMCIYPAGGTGHVYGDNICTNWQDYGSLQSGVVRNAYIGNSFKQSATAISGADAKAFSITAVAGDGNTQTFTYNFALAGDSDLGIRIVNADGTKIYMSNEQGYTLDLINSTVTFNSAPANGSDVEIFHRRWADHGPIRVSDALSLVVAQNDLFNNVGWFGDGVHHNPALRYNTNGTAGHSGVIVENRVEGGTMAAVFEPANPSITANAGRIMIERNLFIGTKPAYYGIRLRYGNVTIRNNVILQPDVLSSTNAYWSSVHFAGNGTSNEIPANYSAPIEIYNNTIVNLATDQSTENGLNSIDYEPFTFDDRGDGSAYYTDVTQVNSIVYAPQTANTAYHSNPNLDENYLPSPLVDADDGTLQGIFDTFNGDLRTGSIRQGVEQ